MQDSIRAGGEIQSRLANPFLDLAVATLEAQLKAWQTYHVEGTRFVAKRLRADLEYLRALGHCSDMQSTGECQRAWFREMQKDYGEEWGRIAATGFTLTFGDLSRLGWMFGQRPPKETQEAPNAPQKGQPQKSPSGLQAAA
ncbi:MAG: hypothetical protein R6X03_09020 [Methyloceanibacter sp.]|jgi:hypothetical protein